MTIAPLRLMHLSQEHMEDMYKRAEENERIFRNILVTLADKAEEAIFFKAGKLQTIFDRYVCVSGYDPRVSDFRVGPFESQEFMYRRFRDFTPTHMKQDNALVLVEHSNNSKIEIYQTLPESLVRKLDTKKYYQH